MTAEHTGPITAKGLAAGISKQLGRDVLWGDLRPFGAATWNHKFTAKEAGDITGVFRKAEAHESAAKELRNPRRGRRGR